MEKKTFCENLQTVFSAIDRIDKENPELTELMLFEYHIDGKDVKLDVLSENAATEVLNSSEVPLEYAACIDNDGNIREFTFSAGGRMGSYSKVDFAWETANQWAETNNADMPNLIYYLMNSSTEMNLTVLKTVAEYSPELIREAGIDVSTLPDFLNNRETNEELIQLWKTTDAMRGKLSETEEKCDADLSDIFVLIEREMPDKHVGFSVEYDGSAVTVYVTYADEDDSMDTKDKVFSCDVETFENAEEFAAAFTSAWNRYVKGLKVLELPMPECDASPRLC